MPPFTQDEIFEKAREIFGDNFSEMLITGTGGSWGQDSTPSEAIHIELRDPTQPGLEERVAEFKRWFRKNQPAYIHNDWLRLEFI